MAKFKDLQGQKFGRLTVLERMENSQRTENHRPRTQWLCVCDCGKQTVVRSENLVAGTTLSCGCLQKEAASAANKRETPFIVKDDIAIGKTAQGIEFIIDAEDLSKVAGKTWHINAMGYPQTNIYRGGTSPLLHRLIMGDYEKGYCVDHIDRDKLNNRKSNLRICRQGDNAKNSGLRVNNTSGFTGVRKQRGRWYAEIQANGKTHYLGSFNNFDDAVNARIEGEKRYFGEYAPTRSDGVYFSTGKGWN